MSCGEDGEETNPLTTQSQLLTTQRKTSSEALWENKKILVTSIFSISNKKSVTTHLVYPRKV